MLLLDLAWVLLVVMLLAEMLVLVGTVAPIIRSFQGHRPSACDDVIRRGYTSKDREQHATTPRGVADRLLCAPVRSGTQRLSVRAPFWRREEGQLADQDLRSSLGTSLLSGHSLPTLRPHTPPRSRTVPGSARSGAALATEVNDEEGYFVASQLAAWLSAGFSRFTSVTSKMAVCIPVV